MELRETDSNSMAMSAGEKEMRMYEVNQWRIFGLVETGGEGDLSRWRSLIDLGALQDHHPQGPWQDK